MSTKKQLKEEAAKIEAHDAKGEAGVRVVYLIVCLLLVAGFIGASKSALFLAKNASTRERPEGPLHNGFESAAKNPQLPPRP